MVKTILLIAAIQASSPIPHDYEGAKQRSGMALSECAMFYSLNVKRAQAMGWAEAAEGFQLASNRAVEMAVAMVPEEMLKAHIHSSSLRMDGTIKEEGWTGLVLRYGDICKTALEAPKPGFQYLLVPQR
jgi:hypothetical protein